MDRLALGQGGETDLVGRMVHRAAMEAASEAGRSPFQVVLEAVRERVTGLLTPAQLENPGPAEREALRQAVAEEIARYGESAPVQGLALLDEPVDVVAERVLDEILGLGPLEALLADEAIEDVYVLGPQRVLVITAEGERRPVPLDFGSRERLMNLVRRALAQDGKRVDFSQPFADARLRDGSRLHVSNLRQFRALRGIAWHFGGAEMPHAPSRGRRSSSAATGGCSPPARTGWRG